MTTKNPFQSITINASIGGILTSGVGIYNAYESGDLATAANFAGTFITSLFALFGRLRADKRISFRK